MDDAMSMPQNKFQKILYQTQQISISYIETSAFQAVQQNEGCTWKKEQKCLLISVKWGEKLVYLAVLLISWLTVVKQQRMED